MNATQQISTSFNNFNPEILKTGTDEEKQQQIFNWSHGKNSSIYVHWIPDEMLPDTNGNDIVARNFFQQFGEINRIDFVPKINDQGKCSGHMVFVHFEYLFNSQEQVQLIINSYPHAAAFKWSICKGNRNYTIKCCINMRSIVNVEFNASQLTDMIKNINLRLTNELNERDNIINCLNIRLTNELYSRDFIINDLNMRLTRYENKR